MKNLWRSLIIVNLIGSSIGVHAVLAESESLESIVSSQLLRHAVEGKGEEVTAQVTSVSQLSDVQPTDWAFTALQSLVERYGCIAGYPDKTFRGNRALSRYEFAAGLNACLDKVNELMAVGLTDKVGKEDLATLQQMQTEFARELAALKGRVDGLETKTDTLEAQQFSTTTKLTGQVIGAISGGGSGNSNILLPNGQLSGNSGSAGTTLVNRVRLELNTTFSGEDLLLTRLQAGNGGSNIGSFLDGIFATNSDLAYSGVGNTVKLEILRYDFSPVKDLRISVASQMDLSDKIDINSFANDESRDFSSKFFINNPLILPLNSGAGALVDWNPGAGAFSFRVGYVAGNGSSPTGGVTENPIGNNIFPASSDLTNGGLFGDPYQATVELEFAPKQSGFAARLQYTNASIGNLDFNIGGVNLEWAINPNIALFGRFGFGGISNRISTINPYTWSAGIAFPDLIRPGSLGAIAVGQPFVEGTVGNSTQTNIEAFFKFPLSQQISITPDLQFIINPNNNSGNGVITIATLRTVFNF